MSAKERKIIPPSKEDSGVLPLDPIQRVKQVAKEYDQIAEVFLAHRLDPQEGFNVFVFPELMTVLNGHIQDARVLDFGCGPGVVPMRYVEAGAREVVGVDISDKMILLANQEYRKHYPKIYFELEYLFDYPQDYFDMIVSTYVLDHLDDEKLLGVLTKWKKTLKPDGKIFVVGPHEERHQKYWEESGNTGDFREGWHWENWSGANSHYLPTYWRRMESWFELFDEAGLKVKSVHEPISNNAHYPEVLNQYPDIAKHYEQKRFIIWEMQIAKAQGDNA